MNDTTTLPAIGSEIEDASAFDALPIGTILTDQDGWLHTKVSNRDLPNGEQAPFTTTYVNPDAAADDVSKTGTFFAPWTWGATVTSYPEPEVEATARPVRALPHGTQRGYALKARSPKCLSDDHNDVLTAAGNGEEVDVFAFRQAATAALSLAATRAGQSMARRDWTREARALIHWADAILENHLDGLPVYAEGDRSRAVEAAKEGLADATREVESLTEALANVRAERDLAVQSAQSLSDDLDEARREALRAGSEAAASARQAAARIDRNVFNYALSLLSITERQRVHGFADGVTGAKTATATI